MEAEILARTEDCGVCVMRHTVGMCPAAQTFMARIAELEQRIAELEQRIAELEQRIAELERFRRARFEGDRARERVAMEQEWREKKWLRLP